MENKSTKEVKQEQELPVDTKAEFVKEYSELCAKYGLQVTAFPNYIYNQFDNTYQLTISYTISDYKQVNAVK